jgi:hypothetical protein
VYATGIITLSDLVRPKLRATATAFLPLGLLAPTAAGSVKYALHFPQREASRQIVAWIKATDSTAPVYIAFSEIYGVVPINFINGPSLGAMDAITLKTLYSSNRAANSRDIMPPLAHFVTPIVADGRVFMGTQNSLVVYGLLSGPLALAGHGQFATAASKPPLQAQAREPRNFL